MPGIVATRINAYHQRLGQQYPLSAQSHAQRPRSNAPAPVHALGLHRIANLEATASLHRQPPPAPRPAPAAAHTRPNAARTPSTAAPSISQLERLYTRDYQWLHAPHTRPAFRQNPQGTAALQQRMSDVALELLSRPGFWNSGVADAAMPLMPRVDLWPAGRALRIVDCNSGCISLFGNGRELHHDPARAATLLPEPADDEIVVLRTGNHYQLIQRDQDQVLRDVPADGDCFFSCLSYALGATDQSLAARNQSLRHSLVRLLRAKPELIQFLAPDIPMR